MKKGICVLLLLGAIVNVSGCFMLFPDNTLTLAEFSYEITPGPYPKEVKFTDESDHAESYFWDFKDNSTSREKDPVHIFEKTIGKDVLLKVHGLWGSDSVVKSISLYEYKCMWYTISVDSIPYQNTGGQPWDPTDGPDLYYIIRDWNHGVVITGQNQEISNVSPTNLPLSWQLTDPFIISYDSPSFFIEIWDKDVLPDMDDRIGFVEFNRSSQPSHAYMGLIDLKLNKQGTSVVIHSDWY